jgi:hypothetical protein
LSFRQKIQRFDGLTEWQNFILLRRSMAACRNLQHFVSKITSSCPQRGVKSVTFDAMQYIGKKLAIHTHGAGKFVPFLGRYTGAAVNILLCGAHIQEGRWTGFDAWTVESGAPFFAGATAWGRK